MKIVLNDNIIENGYLKDKYSKYASDDLKREGVPYVNFPFSVSDVNTKYISWVFLDYDSNPVVNFTWIHWLIANYDITNDKEVVEDLTNSSRDYVGGVNTFACPLANVKDVNVIHGYGGPTPPDCDHEYTLRVYSHDEPLALNDGFYYNDFVKELSIKSIDKASITIMAKK